MGLWATCLREDGMHGRVCLAVKGCVVCPPSVKHLRASSCAHWWPHGLDSRGSPVQGGGGARRGCGETSSRAMGLLTEGGWI